jgi:hypothetical protein
MSLTFLHTADWQLGKPYARVTDDAKRARLQSERFECLKRIANAVRQHQASFVLVAGDLFDSPSPLDSTVAMACEAIGQMGVTLLSVPGGENEALSSRLAILARDSINPNRQVPATPEALGGYIRGQVRQQEMNEKYAISRNNKDFTLRMNESGFLTVEEYSHVHKGGPHGYGFSRFWNLDIATGNPVKLADFVNPGYEENWALLGRAAILAQRGLPADASLVKAGLHEDHIELNTNWFLVPGGIGFRYSPYEIAPYAMGEIEFILPWKDIIQHLKPGTKVHKIAKGGVPRE